MKSVYQTSDGSLFNKREEAAEHERLLDLEKTYNKDKLYTVIHARNGHWNEYVDWDDFLLWAKRHKEFLKQLIQLLEG